MTTAAPDFVAIGGPKSPAAFGALTALRLGRSAGLLTGDTLPAGERETLVSSGAPVAFGPAPLRAEHIPWAWLDAEIVLAAPMADEIDHTMLGRFSRSLVGVMGAAALGLTGVGAVFVAEQDVPAGPVAAPIALSLGPRNGARLWWQGGWQDVPADARTRRDADPPILAAAAAAFLTRLTETRDATAAARFAAAAAALLPPAPRFTLEDIPTREAIADAEVVSYGGGTQAPGRR